MSCKDVLQSEIVVCEGMVLEVSKDSIWVEDANGHQTSILLVSPSDNFRTGHRVKVATMATVQGVTMVKALNLTTGMTLIAFEQMQEWVETSGLRGFLGSGAGVMLALKPAFILTLFIPLFNIFTTTIYALLMLGMAAQTLSPWKTFVKSVLVGLTAFALFILICMLSPSLYFFGFEAPAVGVFLSYCYFGRILIDESNRAIEKVDRKLELIPA